ncbi:MAG: chromate resistance protein ChrB domain-containing protein [Vicinamibacterales bacterium]
MNALRHEVPRLTPTVEARPAGPWLLLALQLPAHPSNGRVKTWRRLQQMGAIALKGSLYALPNSAQAVEDFEWLRAEVRGLKGQANIFAAASLNSGEDTQIIELFRLAREDDYKAFIRDAKKAQVRASRASARDEESAKALRLLEVRLTTLRSIDFFSAPSRPVAEQELAALDQIVRPTVTSADVQDAHPVDPRLYQGRLWITRPRPGVDRMASAWLISRFIDHAARFDFAVDASDRPDGVPFDMYDTGFGHEGDACTFEVLQARFQITDLTVRRVGEIVHDLDLKEERYRLPQTAGVAAMVAGLQSAFSDDAELLAQGIVMFDAVFRGLQSQLAAKPRLRRVRPR